MSKNDIVSEKLGMSASTARSRLVKMLLFRELQRSGNDKCFKCEGVIDDIDHLSIEHKIAWLNRAPSLYWDLDNIEFSHLACNRPELKPYMHTQLNYERGCRCDGCKSAHAKNNREWRWRTGRRKPRGISGNGSTTVLHSVRGGSIPPSSTI